MCVRRVVKGFIYPRNTLKDAKISKKKIGWFVFARHDQALAVADAQTRRARDRRSLFDPWNIRAIRGDPSTLQRRMKNSAEDSGRYNRRSF
jgi:hypothetical protein